MTPVKTLRGRRDEVAVVHPLPDGALHVLGLALNLVIVKTIGIVGGTGEHIAIGQPDFLVGKPHQTLDVVR